MPRHLTPRNEVRDAVRSFTQRWSAGLALGLALTAAVADAWAATALPYALGDLTIYREALQYQSAGGYLYDYALSRSGAPALGFTYPPFAALALQPLLWVPSQVSNALWTVGTFVAIAWLVWFVVSTTPRDTSTWLGAQPTRTRWVLLLSLAALAMFMSEPVVSDIILGQISLGLVAVALYEAAGRQSRSWRGLLIGIAGAVKLTPLIFVPFFLVTRQWRAAATALGGFAGATALAWLIFPRESLDYWTRLLWMTSRVGDASWNRNKSLWGLLVRWSGGWIGASWLWALLCLTLAVVALWRAWRHVVRGEQVEAALVVGCLSIVLTPISWPHHQVWGVLAGIVLALHRRGLWATAGAGVVTSFLLLAPTFGQVETGPLLTRLIWEIPTLIFVAICILGLPRHGQLPRVTRRSRAASTASE